MPKAPLKTARSDLPVRVRRGYFECRYGQMHVHHSMPPGGGFEEATSLLCVHDVDGSGRSFVGAMAQLGRDRSTYAPDLPGCGESDPPPTRVAAVEYAGALGDFLDTMRLKRLDVLAVNAGAVLAAELALTRPSQVRRVAWVCDTAATPPAGATDTAHWSAGVAAQYPLRERLARLSQPLLMLRTTPQSSGAPRSGHEPPAAARVVDLAASSAQVLSGSVLQAIQQLQEFLRG